MIRINRPVGVPDRLKRLGERQTRLDCEAYDTSSDDYHSGNKGFPKRNYYSAPEVKDVLVEMHYSKCCYCEKRYTTRAYLHVEHFRPKSGFRQARKQTKDELPGYYWLAYRWENLLLSCHDCNSVYKRTFFPLSNSKKRARCHNDEIAEEHPVLVNPADEDPRDHIRFDEDLPTATSRRGCATIVRLGLRRPNLREDRLKLLGQIKRYHEIIELSAERLDDTELQAIALKFGKFISDAKQRDSDFSSMVIDYCTRVRLQTNGIDLTSD